MEVVRAVAPSECVDLVIRNSAFAAQPISESRHPVQVTKLAFVLSCFAASAAVADAEKCKSQTTA